MRLMAHSSSSHTMEEADAGHCRDVAFSLEDELDFVLATFERALGGASRLAPLPPDAPPETVSHDRQLAADLKAQTAAFRSALLQLEPSVEALRASALGAYVAVRTAYELRRPPAPDGPVELAPFDAEDRFLAGIR